MKPPLLLGILSLLIAGSFETAAAQESDIGWPREIDHAGHAIVLYQPQLESFEGDRLTARAAVSVTPGGSDQMVFGAVWIDAYVETDRDSRTVTVMNVDIPRVRFPNADADQERQLAEILVQDLETQDLVISLDRILAGLDLVERERTAAEGLATEPPNILFTTEPSILVVLDGKPVLHDIDDTNLQRIVNTPYTIVFDQDPWGYYLYAGEESWLTATDVMGRWELADQVPADVAALVPPDSGGVEAEPEDAETESEPVNLGDLRVVVVTEPTELIISAGPPSYASIAGTDLIYVSNTESDVFLNIETQEYYIVLTGRWYKSESLDGPWSYVASDSLPDDFAKIPPESARGSVLVYVAGTDEARDAVLDNAIPETSAVRRDATLDVVYDGEPQFQQIEGTGMKYAVNTEYQVLEIEGKYYACYQGVWYEADDPNGPFAVAMAVPDEVQEIPPENPNYNVKYVYVYDYTPEVVYVGYTPGYTSSYIYGPTVVYGTGYWYRPWVSPYYYYPRPVTYGFRVSYNPWYGWSFRFGLNYGPFHFGFSTGPSYWYRRGGWWGPAGYRHGYYHGYHRGYGAGYRAGYRAGRYTREPSPSLYNRPGNAPRIVDRATARAQLPQRSRARPQSRERPQAGQRPAAAQRPQQLPSGRDRQRLQPSQGRQNDVFTDRNGDVYRRNQDGSWQERTRDGWSSTDRSRVQTRQSDMMRPGGSRDRSNLNRDYQARQRGTQRAQSYQRSRSAVPSGRARTGGRRR
ncbi:MAG: hypothetical protein PVI01_00055 [Gemmatimonadales bacterium]|jgi:hypothetical protein